MAKYMVVVSRRIELFYEADNAEEAEEMAQGEMDVLISEYMEEDGSVSQFFQFEAYKE